MVPSAKYISMSYDVSVATRPLSKKKLNNKAVWSSYAIKTLKQVKGKKHKYLVLDYFTV